MLKKKILSNMDENVRKISFLFAKLPPNLGKI